MVYYPKVNASAMMSCVYSDRYGQWFSMTVVVHLYLLHLYYYPQGPKISSNLESMKFQAIFGFPLSFIDFFDNFEEY